MALSGNQTTRLGYYYSGSATPVTFVAKAPFIDLRVGNSSMLTAKNMRRLLLRRQRRR